MLIEETASLPILVVGGAGYIGSHMVVTLLQAGFQPIVLDILAYRHSLPPPGVVLVEGDMGDVKLLQRLFNEYSFAAVIHLAALIEVGASVKFPAKYYQNNVAATLNLLDVMLQHQVKNLIFSSSAAVYGQPQYSPIDETHPLLPINPYGRTKRMIEEVLADYARSDDLSYVALRYFNAAGADPAGRWGECHEPETHLIPLILKAVLQQTPITVYGNDYATPDGTCIRDYIHVVDLCAAHLLALKYLLKGRSPLICNLGTGQGYSVQEVINAAQQVTGYPIAVEKIERREGDPARLVADAKLAKNELAWQPRYPEIETMITHAWNFLKIIHPSIKMEKI